LNQGVFCSSCGGTCEKGIEIIEVFLNSLSDIIIKGNCKVCDGKVIRVKEFGADIDFFNKANDFRKSIDK
jgi:hypothetical protein